MYTAGDKIKAMAASGELEKIHKKCDEMEASVDTAYIKTMDLLTRTEIQINQAENDIYEDIKSNHELAGIRLHPEGLNGKECYITADNFELAKSKLPTD